MPFYNCRICGDHYWESPFRIREERGLCHHCLGERKKERGKIGMLRFYRRFAAQIYLILLHYRDRGGSWNDCIRYTKEYWNHYDPSVLRHHTIESVGLAASINEDMDSEGENIDDLINHLISQLTVRESEVKDKTLIDAIVETLKLPFVGSVLAGNTLQSLKKAILVPDELAGLQERLAQKELHCSNCGHRFINGEMVSIHGTGTGRSNPQLYCTSCYTPGYSVCNYCKTTKPFSKAVTKLLGRIHQCEQCADIIKRGIPIPTPSTDNQEEEGGRVELRDVEPTPFGGMETRRPQYRVQATGSGSILSSGGLSQGVGNLPPQTISWNSDPTQWLGQLRSPAATVASQGEPGRPIPQNITRAPLNDDALRQRVLDDEVRRVGGIISNEELFARSTPDTNANVIEPERSEDESGPTEQTRTGRR